MDQRTDACVVWRVHLVERGREGFVEFAFCVRALLGQRVCRAPSRRRAGKPNRVRSEEHTSELQSLMRISYAVVCLKKKRTYQLRCSHTPYNKAHTDQPHITRTLP